MRDLPDHLKYCIITGEQIRTLNKQGRPVALPNLRETMLLLNSGSYMRIAHSVNADMTKTETLQAVEVWHKDHWAAREPEQVFEEAIRLKATPSVLKTPDDQIKLELKKTRFIDAFSIKKVVPMKNHRDHK